MAAATAVVLLTLLAAVSAKTEKYYLGEVGSNMQIRNQLYISDRPRQTIQGLTRVFSVNEAIHFVANGITYSLDGTAVQLSDEKPPETIDVTISMSGSFKITELNSKDGAVANYTIKLGGESSARFLVVKDMVFAIHDGELYAMDRKNMKIFGNTILAQRIPAFGAKVIDIMSANNSLADTLLIATNHAEGGDIWRLTSGKETFEPACVQPDESQLNIVQKLVDKFENEMLTNSVSEEAAVSEYTDAEAYELKKQMENLRSELKTLIEKDKDIQHMIKNVHLDKSTIMRSRRDTPRKVSCIDTKIADTIFKELDEINENLNNTITQMMEDVEKLLEITKQGPDVNSIDIRFDVPQ